MNRRPEFRNEQEFALYQQGRRERFTSAVSASEPVAGTSAKTLVSRGVKPVAERLTYERDVLSAVLDYLALCPRVAWFHRMNTGGVEREYNGKKRFIAFAFPGCSDIIGQLKDGRFLAIECKRPGKVATSDQWQFLCNVNRANGVAFVACGVEDVRRALA